MATGERAFVVYKIKNWSTSTWRRGGANPVRLATDGPRNRVSEFYDSSWVTSNRPANMKEDEVLPGGIATFEFWYQAPQRQLSSREDFTVVIDGEKWVDYFGLYLQTRVVAPVYNSSHVFSNTYSDQNKNTPKNSANMRPGSATYNVVRFKNTGNKTWHKANTNLGTSGPRHRSSIFMSEDWLTPQRPANMREDEVLPGGIATFEFWYQAPPFEYSAHEEFSIVSEGVTWLPYSGYNLNTSVSKPDYSWEGVEAKSYTDQSLSVQKSWENLAPGESVWIVFRLKNNGNVTWRSDSSYRMRLGTADPLNRSSEFCTVGWLNCNRPSQLKEASVEPNQIGTFEFWYKAPIDTSVYRERFRPVIDGVSWMQDRGLYFESSVD